MEGFIRCYRTPINVADLGEEIFVPLEGVYSYTKELYELGRGYRSILPIGEAKALEFYHWTVRYNSLSRLSKWVVDRLIG